MPMVGRRMFSFQFAYARMIRQEKPHAVGPYFTSHSFLLRHYACLPSHLLNALLELSNHIFTVNDIIIMWGQACICSQRNPFVPARNVGPQLTIRGAHAIFNLYFIILKC